MSTRPFGFLCAAALLLPGPALAQEVDVLIALDLSCSMYDDISGFQGSVWKLVESLDNQGLDWQAAVVTQDSGCANTGIVTTGDVAPARALANAMDPSSYPPGANTERLFTLATDAIAADLPGACNDGLFRSSALLHLVVVSDEPEQSSVSWSTKVADLVAAKGGDSSLVRISAITGPIPRGCGGASAGSGYVQASIATGGIFLPICAGLWDGYAAHLGFASVP